MQHPNRKWSNTYQLVLSEDGRGTAGKIQFEATSPESALFFLQQQCGGREAELFENDRSLGRVRCVRNGGYWVISPPALAAEGEKPVAARAASSRTS